MSSVVRILVIVVIIVTQSFLSSRKNPYLGGILPVVYIGFIIFFFNKLLANGDYFSTWLTIMGGLCGLLSIWISGRERFKKKRQKELDRIELQNL
ncbi:hypothetical protein H9I32_08380 [Bacillus sp. Xin]|uniref:hypothetical protein n=1 Tax=unclassified Bacillus (in: firmicutes) TaxID=185979 RepID=UPI001573F32F|nr:MULTISPECIES: hypothetical protein [unclassified Bacillus (in: firmicutes)]MBC6972425.1 hypothetical protein [Bacillus sp. Xin]NSW39581.1 hypothetical protein [Bacillus sp. Xin1]